MICCQTLDNGAIATIRYDLMVMSGYYDGVTNGAFRCATCSRAFAFDMVAEDFELEVRIFVLAPIPGEAFAGLFQTPCLALSPTLPLFWHDLNIANEDELVAIEAAWAEFDHQRGEPQWIASGQAIDQPLRWRAVTTSLAERLPRLTQPHASLEAWQDCLP